MSPANTGSGGDIPAQTKCRTLVKASSTATTSTKEQSTRLWRTPNTLRVFFLFFFSPSHCLCLAANTTDALSEDREKRDAGSLNHQPSLRTSHLLHEGVSWAHSARQAFSPGQILLTPKTLRPGSARTVHQLKNKSNGENFEGILSLFGSFYPTHLCKVVAITHEGGQGDTWGWVRINEGQTLLRTRGSPPG